MHPRLTILTRVFERQCPLEEKLETLVDAGAVRAGLSAREVTTRGAEATRAALVDAGVEVTHLGHGPLIALAGDQRDQDAEAVCRSIDLARATGAPCIYGPPGGAPALEWDDAADRFVAAMAPVARYAAAQAIPVLIEPTISLFADICMLHTLRDTVDLAERVEIGVCIDVQHCWTERGLRETIARAVPHTGLVQFSDWLPGNRVHFRAVPGDGAIPLERILGWILEAGYQGRFDLEVYAEPDVAERDTIVRALERGGALLERLGA